MLLMYWRKVMNDCPQGIKNEKEIEKLGERFCLFKIFKVRKYHKLDAYIGGLDG